MNLVDPTPPADPAAVSTPVPALSPSAFSGVDAGAIETPVGPSVITTPAAHVRTAKLRQDVIAPVEPPRKATESEIKQAHELLYGPWTILSVERDGETLGDDLIRNKVAKDSRVVFGNRTITIPPQNGAAERLELRVTSKLRAD